MSVLLQIEAAIIAQLQPLGAIHKARIVAYDAQELLRSRGGNEIFVNHNGLKPSQPQHIGNITQIDVHEFEIFSKIAGLQTHEIAYPLLEDIRNYLTGFEPILGTLDPLIMVDQKFIPNFVGDGVWAYSQLFRMSIKYQQTQNFQEYMNE